MKINVAFIIACAGTLSLWAASPSLGGQSTSAAGQTEQTVKCEDAPPAVRAAFQKSYPQATIDGCAKEAEKDKAAYEIMSTEGKIKRDVLFYEDGKLIVAEEAIAESDLPMAVQQAMAEVLADHKIELVEKLMRDDTVTYEIQSKHEGVPLEVVFDGSGKVLKVAAAVESTAPETQEKDKNEDEDDEEKDEGHE